MCFPRFVYLVVHVCSSVHILYLIKMLLKFFCLILLVFLQRTQRQTALTLLLLLVSLSHCLPTITIFPAQPLSNQCHLEIMRCEKILVKATKSCIPDYKIILSVKYNFTPHIKIIKILTYSSRNSKQSLFLCSRHKAMKSDTVAYLLHVCTWEVFHKLRDWIYNSCIKENNCHWNWQQPIPEDAIDWGPGNVHQGELRQKQRPVLCIGVLISESCLFFFLELALEVFV